MNKKLLIVCLIASGAIACNSGSSTGNKNSDSTTKEEKAVEKVKEAASGIEEVKGALGKLVPISTDDLRKLLPSQISGVAPNSTEVENSSGVNIATANYKLDDTTVITLSIIDCAGPAGVGIYNSQHLSLAAAEGETENEYTKAVKVNGDKGYEHCTKDDNMCSLAWFTGGRYLVSIEGVPTDRLKQLAGEVKIK